MYKVGRSRTPQGVRGLKHMSRKTITYARKSHSTRSAWIETACFRLYFSGSRVALHKECVD